MRFIAVLFAVAATATPALAGLPVGRPVPPAQAAAIERRAGPLALLPKRMLLGFRYAGWRYRPGVLTVRFTHKGAWTVVYTARPYSGSCPAGAQQSFQLDGNKAWWAPATAGQQAWRCVGRVKVAASISLPSTRFAPTGLGQVVAAAGRY